MFRRDVLRRVGATVPVAVAGCTGAPDGAPEDAPDPTSTGTGSGSPSGTGPGSLSGSGPTTADRFIVVDPP
ncbi:hypothetical protein BRD00_05570 [Halobacteriales archaeon QS_8_69_26]|nr:MAG: hypothetical protein BRD00_05570 [Halobacteriales archaeon QS_8_69_26]